MSPDMPDIRTVPIKGKLALHCPQYTYIISILQLFAGFRQKEGRRARLPLTYSAPRQAHTFHLDMMLSGLKNANRSGAENRPQVLCSTGRETMEGTRPLRRLWLRARTRAAESFIASGRWKGGACRLPLT
jgi:hypothetical protein